MKNGLTYQVWFDQPLQLTTKSAMEMWRWASCIIKQKNIGSYSFKIEPTTGGSFFRMLTEDLRLNTRLLDTFLPLIKAHYLDFIDRFGVDPAGSSSRFAPAISSRGLQLVHPCAGTDGGTVRKVLEDLAVRGLSERRSTRQAGWVRCCSTSPTPMMWIMPGPQAAPRGTGPGGGTLCAGQAADRTVDSGG